MRAGWWPYGDVTTKFLAAIGYQNVLPMVLLKPRKLVCVDRLNCLVAGLATSTTTASVYQEISVISRTQKQNVRLPLFENGFIRCDHIYNQPARSLDTRNKMPFDSRAKGPPANRREKGYGGDNGYSIVKTNVSRVKWKKKSHFCKKLLLFEV